MKIYLDFDGTVVEHNYPQTGAANEGCVVVIQKLQVAGHQIILNTYRANISAHALQIAVDYLATLDIEPITEIQQKKINPPHWNLVNFKEKGELFIDDICEGTPLKKPQNVEYDIVDWATLDQLFQENNIY